MLPGLAQPPPEPPGSEPLGSEPFGSEPSGSEPVGPAQTGSEAEEPAQSAAAGLDEPSAFDDDPSVAGPPANWLETRVAIEDLADAEDFAAALALRDRLLELTEAEFGAESTQVADAHLLMADVLGRDGDYRAAEQEILAAITVLESIDGPLSTALIEPFVVLGDNYGEAGEYDRALASYDEARNIGRRNFGLLNEGQLILIDDMTEAAEAMGQIEEARDLQLESLILIERIYGEISPQATEALFTYAVWLRKHRFYEEERQIYFRMERTISQHYDDDPLMLVRVFRARAASLRDANSGDPIGLAGLRDALDLLRDMDEPPPLLTAEVLTEIGDWSVEFGRTGSTGEEYLRAWQLLGIVENGTALRDRWFDDLNVIEILNLARRGLSTDPEHPQGHVVVYFTVDTVGRTQDIEITESEPAGFKDAAVMRLMREARFRPRIVDGEIIPTRRAYRFEFRYVPEEVVSD